MPMMRYAFARVVHPDMSTNVWGKVRIAAAKTGQKVSVDVDLLKKAEGILGEPFTPDKFLLTHATIVASVDVEQVTNCKTGKVKVGSESISRPWDDYYITPQTAKLINSNGDAWSRGVLKKSYHTFIGGQNFQEHVQLEEHSKGRIIDAVLRDVGDSLYVDILIATDRKHKDLVADIESGKMATLSMGCLIQGSQCSKCGNWAPDETQACSHIKYEKGNSFFDERGVSRKVGELCGHESLDGGGVTFIEASWVETPAFTGAALRNILDPIQISSDTLRKAQEMLSHPPTKWVTPVGRQKAARFLVTSADDFGGEDEGGAAPTPEAKDPLDDAVDKTYKEVMDRVQRKVQEKLRGTGTEPPPASDAGKPSATNNSLGKDAHKKLAALTYRAGLNALVRTASSKVDLMQRVAAFNASQNIGIPSGLYRAASRVGGTHKHNDVGSYLAACRQALGRELGAGDKRTLIRLGHILAWHEAMSRNS